MTIIYDSYHPAISSGEIDLNNVDFSVIVVGKSYNPVKEDTKETVTNVLQTIDNLLVESDIITLTMSEIVDKIFGKVSEENQKKAYGFVTFDAKSEKLCFYENFNNFQFHDEEQQ